MYNLVFFKSEMKRNPFYIFMQVVYHNITAIASSSQSVHSLCLSPEKRHKMERKEIKLESC